jgi:hypothetical protein
MGQTRSFGDVGSMSGLPESGRGAFSQATITPRGRRAVDQLHGLLMVGTEEHQRYCRCCRRGCRHSGLAKSLDCVGIAAGGEVGHGSMIPPIGAGRWKPRLEV